MTKTEFHKIEGHMLEWMRDSAHDRLHIYRVLATALEIAESERDVDLDVLIAACLLHDIGREQQSRDLDLDHARIGGEMAYAFLTSIGWDAQKAARVRACVRTHRYRKCEPPESIEARILFDADKLDVTGAVGVARTLIYGGQVLEPLYVLRGDGSIQTEGDGAEISSFVQEFNYKLRGIYDKFFTARARSIAAGRRRAALGFYDDLLYEIRHAHDAGAKKLNQILQ